MRDPNGNNPRTIYRDDTYIRSTGLRAQLTPDGDCREAAFEAKGAGLRVPPLSNVQIESLFGSIWTALWYGEVRVGGNARDLNGERYVLRSLARRLGEITLPPGFSTPKQAAHLTVRAILRAVMDSGQLGAFPVIEYDEGRCPDLGFDCREVKNANQQTPAALLEQIAEDGAGLGVTVAWGVGPDRFFFCRPARTDTAELEAPTGNPLMPSSTVALTWQPPVAETPCTAVLWYVAKRPDGTWLTHLSRSPEADRYGLRVKHQSVEQGVEVWERVPGIYEWWHYVNEVIQRISPQPPPPDAAALTDGLTEIDDPRSTSDQPGRTVELRFLSESVIHRVVYAGEVSSVSPTATVTAGVALTWFDPQNIDGGSIWIRRYPNGGWVAATDYLPGPGNYNGYDLMPRGVGVRNVSALGGTTHVRFALAEFRAERINTTLLDGLARHHYAVPAQEPADIETATFRPPRDLAGRVSVGDYNRAVEAWEYRLTAARGLTLAALTGQADDPAKLAQASLIKQRDGQATVNALTAQQ